MAKLVEADLILSKLGLLSENFGQNMSYDTNGSLDRALELAKKTVIIFSFELSKPSKLKSRAMQYSNIDSETENGSSAKRHLGGGRDIHLKMLIPRCLLLTCWS